MVYNKNIAYMQKIKVVNNKINGRKTMEVPYNLKTLIYPEKGKKIDEFDKNSDYNVRILASTDLSKSLYEYAENYYYAAHIITDFILNENHPDIGKLDTYFFAIAFLYRHCLELGLKAIGFKNIHDKDGRIRFVNDTFHNLYEIFDVLKDISDCKRPDEEMEWLKEYLADLSQMDRESDSFRYPFHIVTEFDEWGLEKQYAIKEIFNEQTHIDLVLFANKFEAGYEIINKWYKKETSNALEWKELKPIFIETGGYYYAQSVVGYRYNRARFYPYTKAYLETANYLKWYCKNKTGAERANCMNRLFLPMCYLYRNCVELSLKGIWFEEIGEDFQKKCKFILGKKHSIAGLWNKIKPYIINVASGENDLEYSEIVEDYCMQVHSLDNDANKFRYPMTKNMRPYFSCNKRFDFIGMGDFLEELNNSLDSFDCALNSYNEYIADMEAEYWSDMMTESDFY